MSEFGWPEQWPTRSVKLLVSSLAVGLLDVILAIGVVQLWVRDGLLSAVPFLGFLWVLLPAAVVGVVAQPRGPGRNTERIRSAPVDPSDPASRRAVLVPTHPFWRLSRVWFVLPAVLASLRGRTVTGLWLEPDGVRQRTPFRETFVPWDQIQAVVPYFWSAEGMQWQILLGIRGESRSVWKALFGRRAGEIAANLLAVDPALVLGAVEFYWRHADLRVELASEAGVRRIRSGALQAYG